MEIDPLIYPQPRTRHHTNPQFYLPLSSLKVVPSNYPPLVDTLDWSSVFRDNRAPEALDIGCGWGKFLLDYAERYADVNILGLETRQQAVRWINEVIRGESVPNASALYYSVANGLPFIADRSIARAFYFFPDPWFKKRHFKRRAFTRSILDELHRVLRPDGVLYLMTDVPEVDEYQRALLEDHGAFTVHVLTGDDDWPPVRTDHELACIRRGFSYVRLRCTVHT